MTLVDVLVALLIAVGLAGVLVPVLPGLLLIAAAVVGWAIATGGATAWGVAGLALVIMLVGSVVKYTIPGRRLQAAGIPGSTQWWGALGAVVGFFVIPVVGIVVGFPVGVYLAEYRRLGAADAWPSTVHALRAVGLSILIELLAGVAAAVVWGVGVVVA